MSVPAANLRDSMKSTWRSADKSTWSLFHHIYDFLDIQPTDLNREVPVFQKTDKMSYVSQVENNKFVFFHAAWPMVLHQIYVSATGRDLAALPAFLFYMFAFNLNATHAFQVARELGHKHGFFDGDKHPRDQVPDQNVMSVFGSLALTSFMRPMLAIFFTYRSNKAPLSISPWIPVEIGLYGVILDFWFYWYQRVMHDNDSLWKFHRKHHMTKHPNALLTLYADSVQEIFDVAGVPLFAWGTLKLMGFPMEFYDWWMCHMFVMYTELWGHSGVRLYITPPSPASPILRYFNAELTTEDHDLHHRKGWKKSHNYGKQTLLWDKVFGTALPRIESTPENIDFTSPQKLPLFNYKQMRTSPPYPKPSGPIKTTKPST